MSDIEVESVSAEGFTTENEIDGEWSLVIDALGEDGPDPNQVLVADYASCYIPAFRVGAQQEGYEDIGRVEVDVSADLNEDDDLEYVGFDIRVEASLGEDKQAVVERGEDICHVHAALRDGLHADISVEDDAF